MLTREKFIITLVCLLVAISLQSQSCPPAPTPGETCFDAPLVGCELDGYMGSSAGFQSSPLFNGFCGLIENDQHFKIIVESSPVAIQIVPSNCEKSKGLQAVLYRTSDCTNRDIVALCASFGTVQPLNVVAPNVSVGEELYLMIDGFEGDVCDFTIDVIVGVKMEVEEQEEEEKCALDVALGYNFLRRCFSNKIEVFYCNNTSADEEEVVVKVGFDSLLDIEDTSIPIDGQQDTSLFFNVGDLQVGECGEFDVYVKPNCALTPLGYEHCMSAEILPESTCIEASTAWSGANIVASGSCDLDTTYFTIENKGGADSQELSFILIRDGRWVTSARNFQLDKGESTRLTTFAIAGDATTVELIVDQEPNHPVNDQVAVFASCLGTDEDFVISSESHINQNPSFVSFCLENIGSYDPNDKAATPVGNGPEHFISSDQKLDYKIRFQNTGTDTAFTVVIRDTITDRLDMNTFQAGLSSHNYELSIEEDSIVVFTFNNILLPDSTVNWTESNGYVGYNIEEVDNNLPGTRIENSASIYFDFNSPIHTNTVFHTIRKPIAYKVDDLRLCKGESYNGIQYYQDTVLSELHSTALLDSFYVTNISIDPVYVFNSFEVVPPGTIVGGQVINSDTIFINQFTSSMGCDSVHYYSVEVEITNAANSINEHNLEVYPNPVSDQLNIISKELKSNKQINVRLISILGETVYQENHYNISNNKLSINVDGFNSGAYILHVSDGEKTSTQKIVIQN